ncbi:MAG TPA: hypothetical protein DCY13_08965, partial [Verrucomicrobiales bacterium]|nr:hypothetical protein [Verrucomicrobiales bacterium]
GAELTPGIDILWTGPEVISPEITDEDLRSIHTVLRRPVTLWDNLHANDYHPARLHLGPYTGRTGRLPELTRGVLLNPNCQFEANFVPLATLGTA